jgi:hypothetical protein
MPGTSLPTQCHLCEDLRIFRKFSKLAGREFLMTPKLLFVVTHNQTVKLEV